MAAFGSGAVAAAREEGRSKIQRSRRTPALARCPPVVDGGVLRE
jgi:hypothetical protein